MKKVLVAVLVVAVGLSLGGIVYAAWGNGYGPRWGGQVDVNALRNFQKETLPLRDELMVKRAELRNELAKENPDQNRIATLQKEMIDLRTKIQAAAQKQGLPAQGRSLMMGGRCGLGPRGGYGPGCMMARNNEGSGYGMGNRGGFGRGNCPAW